MIRQCKSHKMPLWGCTLKLIQDLAMENGHTKFEKDQISIVNVNMLTVKHPMIRKSGPIRGHYDDANWDLLSIIELTQSLAMGNVCTKIEKDPKRIAHLRVLATMCPMLTQNPARGHYGESNWDVSPIIKFIQGLAMENTMPCTKFEQDPKSGHENVKGGAPHDQRASKSYRGPLWQCKWRIFTHNRTHPRSCHGECVYQIWKGKELLMWEC